MEGLSLPQQAQRRDEQAWQKHQVRLVVTHATIEAFETVKATKRKRFKNSQRSDEVLKKRIIDNNSPTANFLSLQATHHFSSYSLDRGIE